MKLCPACKQKGSSVSPVTLEAQVISWPRELGTREGWSLCTTESCEVVYFRSEDVILVGETLALPFHKSDDPQRLVCFCFGHTVVSVEADAGSDSGSTIRSSIRAACGEGRDDCVRKNPQGRCCLGNVALVLKNAIEHTASEPEND